MVTASDPRSGENVAAVPDNLAASGSREAPEQAARERSASGSARAAIVDFGLAVTLLGLFSYCLARFLVDGFLAPFHLSFDEIGLDYGELVASGVLFTVPSAVLIVVTYRVSDNIWRRLAPRLMNARTDAARLLSFTLVYLLAAAFLCLLYILAGRYLDLIPLPDRDREAWGGVLRLVLLSVLISAIVALLFDSRGFFRHSWGQAVLRLREAPAGPVPGPWQVMGGLLSSAVLLSLFCFTAYSIGSHYADTVEAGRRLNVTLLGLRLSGVGAKPVRIVMVDGATPTPLPNGACLLMLGERSETVLLFDHHKHQIFRISTQTMYTVEDLDADGC